MSYGNNDGCRFIGQIMFIGVLFLITLCVKTCNNSQWGMMREAREHNDAYNYLSYLDKYPNGDYIDEAIDSVMSIIKQDKAHDLSYIYNCAKKIHAVNYNKGFELKNYVYNMTLADGSEQAWQRYLAIVDDEDKRDAEEQLNRINNAQWGDEGHAWKTATALNTIDAYEHYIDLYPHGEHYRDAMKLYVDQSVSFDLSRQHGTLPQMDQIGIGGGSRSNVSVYNNTEYQLTVLYSGNESDRLVISSHSHGTINLANGTYRISARVQSNGVQPFIGNETLQGGEYEVEYYIMTTVER